MQVGLPRGSVVADAIAKSGRFTLSFLGEQHWPIAERFAAGGLGGPAAFADVGTRIGPGDCPYVSDANAVVRCRLWRVDRFGDQITVSGEVLASFFADPATFPLVFYAGRYHGIGGEVLAREG